MSLTLTSHITLCKELSDLELESILAEIAASDGGFDAGTAAIESFYRLACDDLGLDWDNLVPGSIDPTTIGLKQGQWQIILHALMERRLEGENAGAIWLNVGPTGL